MENKIKTYKGIKYLIFWFDRMGHYNGYVKLPKGHKYEKFDTNIGYNEMDINCHGGLTFSEKVTKKNKDNFLQNFSIGNWIGWDYGHFGDKTKFFGMFSFDNDDYEWSFEEVEEECKNVINQLLKIK